MTSLLPPELLDALAHVIQERFGLHFPPERRADLARAILVSARESQRDDANAYAREVIAGSLSTTEIEVLAAHLTIGETYFFRDPAAFALLQNRVLPDLAARRRAGGARRLRIWSAGCCSGEEPYSIAIAVRRALPDLANWRVGILATDINAQFLRKAAAGIYGRWSFRGVSEETQQTYFRPAGSGQLEVVPSIREMVRFVPLNLVANTYPSLADGTAEIDLIFCRNTLIYFSRAQAEKVIGRLHRALAEDGLLFVSAAEAPPDLFAGFAPVGYPGTVVFRKAHTDTDPAATPPPARMEFSIPIAPPIPRAGAGNVNPVRPEPVEEPTARARRLADAGRFDEALAVCNAAIAHEKLDAGLHHLRAVILEHTGAVGEAIEALKRALFLDHNFVAAHLTLGHLLQRKGRPREAGRSFQSARQVLARCHPDSVIPEAGGMTAGRLLAIVNTMKEEAA
ncbi:MAG: CheR family methyltransferase [Chthoniobacteraceae bacterium]